MRCYSAVSDKSWDSFATMHELIDVEIKNSQWRTPSPLPVFKYPMKIIKLVSVLFGLFDLILYFPFYILSVMSGQVFLVWTSTKQVLMWLA